jgi:DNA-damage-inducible protein J
MTTEPTNLRLDAEAKKQAYEVFQQVGLKPAQAFNLFLQQVAMRKGLPFEIKIPNDETLAAMAELENGGGKSFSNTDDFYKDLGI